MNNNILYVKWDRWDNEIFISIKDNTFYIVEESKFYNDDWTDICYIDNINNIIYRKSNNEKGYFKYENDELIISILSIILFPNAEKPIVFTLLGILMKGN